MLIIRLRPRLASVGSFPTASPPAGFNLSPSFTPPVLPRNQRTPQSPAYTPTFTPAASGSSTPSRGRGGHTGGFTPRGAATPDRGGRGGRGRGRGNFDGAYTPPHSGGGGRGGQRGRGAGGLGFAGVGGRGGALGAGGRGGGFSQFASSPRGGYGNSVVGMAGGAHRPLLVPVKFVPATVVAYGLTGNAQEFDEAQVGEMADQVHGGNLDELILSDGDEDEGDSEDVEVAIEIDVDLDEDESEDDEVSREVERSLLGDLIAPTSTSAEQVEVDTSLAIEVALEQTTLDDTTEGDVETIAFEDFIQEETTPPLLDEPTPMEEEVPLFVIDTTPSAIQAGSGRTLPTRGGRAPLGVAVTSAEHVVQPRVVSIVDDVTVAPVVLPAFEPAPATPPPASALPPRTRPAPTPSHTAATPAKLSKNDKRRLKTAGKKARRAGQDHARSGNQHQHRGFNEYSSDDDEVDQDDLKAGAALFASMGAGEVEVEDLDDELMDGVPRQGDSDLDWGEATPVMRGGLGSSRAPGQLLGASTGRARRAERKEARQAQKEADKLDRLAANARRAVAAQLGTAAAQDYEANAGTGGLGEDTDDDAESIDEDDLRAIQESFVAGLLGGESGGQKTLGELAVEARAKMEEEGEGGWRTTDGEDESEEEVESSSTELDSGDEIEMDYSLASADAE